MLKLQFKDQRQAAIWLSENRFTIGQDASNSLPLRDPGVAPFHAEIRREDDQFFLSDAGSASGSFVNGQRIKSRYQLRAGDNIKIGHVEFELVSPQVASTTPTAQDNWSVQAITGELKGQRFPITGSMTLGRSSGCEICIHDDRVSRRHSELQIKDGVLRIKDLGSANGTFVNRKKIKEQVLASGDQVHFDAGTFLVIGPNKANASQEAEEEDVTVFSSAGIVKPIERPTAVTSNATKPQAIKIDPAIDRQVSIATPTRKKTSSRILIVLAALLIASTAAASYWFYLTK